MSSDSQYAAGVLERMPGQATCKYNPPHDKIFVATVVFRRVPTVVGEDTAAAEKAEGQRRERHARDISVLSCKHIFDRVDASLERPGVIFQSLVYSGLIENARLRPVCPEEWAVNLFLDGQLPARPSGNAVSGVRRPCGGSPEWRGPERCAPDEL